MFYSCIREALDSISAGSLPILTQAYIRSTPHPPNLGLGKCRALPDPSKPWHRHKIDHKHTAQTLPSKPPSL